MYRILQKKQGREWKDQGTEKRKTVILQSLNNELINKYLYKSNWIKRIEIDIYYSGIQNKITVTFDNGYRHIYIIEK